MMFLPERGRPHKSIEIGRERIVIVPDARLARPAEAAAVIRDHAMAGCEQRGGLLLPRVAVQRPAMDEHDWRSGAVVLVVDIDGCGVFLTDFDVAHWTVLFSGLGE